MSNATVSAVQPSIYAMPTIDSEMFSDILFEQAEYAHRTGRWDKLAPIMGHGGPGTGKSASVEALKRRIEKELGQVVHLHIIDANQIELGEFGFMFAAQPGRVTVEAVGALVEDVVGWTKRLFTAFRNKQDLTEEFEGSAFKRYLDKARTEAAVATWFRNGKYPDSNSKDVHIVLIEELASAMPAQQSMLHPLLLDRRIGQSYLPERTMIMSLGNLATDKGFVVDITSPVANRCQHYRISVNVDYWTSIAFEAGIDPAIIAFHRSTDGMHLSTTDMTPYGKGNFSFYSPRSWFAGNETFQMLTYRYQQDCEKGKDTPAALFKKYVMNVLTRMQAHVGVNAATLFSSFVESVEDAPNIDAILNAKDQATVASLVPMPVPNDKEVNTKRMGIVYYILDVMAQKMVQFNPDKIEKTGTPEEIENYKKVWRNCLWFVHAVAEPWGNPMAISAVMTMARTDKSVVGCIARVGGPQMVAWLGTKSKLQFDQRKELEKELLG